MMVSKSVPLGLVVLLFLISCVSVEAQNQKIGQIVIPKINSSIELDGHIGESEWRDARLLPLTQMRPVFGEDPTEKTQVLVGYTRDYLYAACRCYDAQPVSVASFKRDYARSDSDLFAIQLDTFNDNENANIFATSPTGHRADASIINDASGSLPFDMDWGTVWEVEVRQDTSGWFAEMRIPVSSLRFETNEKGQVVMGLTALRFLSRENEFDTYPNISPEWGYFSHMKPSQSEDAVFKDLQPEPPLQVKPYLLAGLGQQHTLNSAGTNYNREDNLTYDAGLDIKYGITSNLTLDMTVNTDFAQIEADNQKVNLSRFPLFFPEKRKFFQERSSNFAFNFGDSNRLFYSRRIGLYRGNKLLHAELVGCEIVGGS